jgi:glycosyltransferase involved in cell wall biosynthesis
MNAPKFTFCIPNLNKIKYLPACIESMLAQDCPHWKCVFVDGYSTDGSWDYMQQFASDSRFLLLQGKRQGMYADWNECLNYIDTEYFYFLTSDDTCYPTLVSTTTAALDRHLDLDACHFQFEFIGDRTEKIEPPPGLVNHCDLYRDVNLYAHRRSGLCEFMMHFIYGAVYLSMTSLVFRRRLLQHLPKFQTNLGSVSDYDWTMKMGLYTDILYLPELLATWRLYPEQATSQMNALQLPERCYAVAKENLSASIQAGCDRALKKPIDSTRLLSYLLDTYTSQLYRQIIESKNSKEFLDRTLTLMKINPTYSLKKVLNRLTFNKLYPYQTRQKIAHQTIAEYGLDWPPVPTD